MDKHFTKKHCPKWCKSKKCHYTLEERTWDEEKKEVKIVHCEALDKATADAMKKLNGFFGKL